MKNKTRWIAHWTDRTGRAREFTFYAPASRSIAGIDFQLECIAAGEPVPERFDLEEGTQVLAALPSPTRLVRMF